ncbi:MAG: glutamate--tRNA ligase [Legionellales bacterium RIFCSPHIGHO2_12_FULL_37_14]|nr:MAG: glutamate--tRNA ligase [Legionellales bacterium RIFCSPHIGHO2_12_FULL_37_14]
MTTITRFAPSPTGTLHVGSARTALYSYLFAKQNAGKFILRIEDTDKERSTAENTNTILEAMDWLNLKMDIGPIYQTERLNRYQEVGDKLLAEGKAYRCTCSSERLDDLRKSQLAAKEKPRYDGHCRDLNLKAGDSPFVVRLKTPKIGEVNFHDLVYGKIVVANSELDDLVLIRQDKMPTYNFAVVIDDIDMQISHVIRGEDHINNTPRQIHIYTALEANLPKFAHLPMLLGEDGKKLSKRHGAVSVLEFRQEGYLHEALLNYLVRLGWSHQNQEIFSLEEMIKYFDWEHVSRSPAIFNYSKLTWLNQHYIKTLPREKIIAELKLQYALLDIKPDAEISLASLVGAMAERCKTMREMAEKTICFVNDKVIYDEEAVQQHLSMEAKPIFQLLVAKLKLVETWDEATLHHVIDGVATSLGQGMGKVAQPLRVALTGSTNSPSIDKTLVLVGKERSLKRINVFLNQWL